MPTNQEVITINKEDANAILASLDREYGPDSAASHHVRTLLRIPVPSAPAAAVSGFKRGDNLVTTQDMRGGGETIPAGSKALYIGLNDEREGYIDVVWLDENIEDNGRRWEGDRFRKSA